MIAGLDGGLGGAYLGWVGSYFGQAEIQDFGATPLRDKDVCRLDVAVYDPFGVLLDDAVVRDRLADRLGGAGHRRGILGCNLRASQRLLF